MAPTSQWLIAAIAFVAGCALWTLLEWLIHNFLGHHGKGKNPFGQEHVRHHATTHYFAPTWKKVLAATPVIGTVLALMWLLSPPFVAVPLVTGLTVMYISYEVIHRRAHTHGPTGPYSRWVRRHHYYHHFRNPRMNHGVSTPIWDMVFGTYIKVTEPIRVPEKHAMSWLVDPETGEVRPEYADDYVIARRGDRKPGVTEAPEDEPPSALAGAA